MNDLIAQLQKTPLPTKLAGLLFLLAGLTAANYFLVIKDIETKIVQVQQEQSTLDSQLLTKQTIANNLNEYRRKQAQLEQQLAQALTELPLNAEIDELLRQLNDVGKKAGLAITSVIPGGETPGGSFYVKIPVAMTVSGSYDEIALFFESVSKLRRIVNISNVTLSSPSQKNEKMVLAAKFSATTFRFQEAAKAKPKKK